MGSLTMNERSFHLEEKSLITVKSTLKKKYSLEIGDTKYIQLIADVFLLCLCHFAGLLLLTTLEIHT